MMMLKYLLIAIWALFFTPSANAQTEASLPVMPPYEERDTIVKYSDGLYQERMFIQRVRIDTFYVLEQERQAEDRKAREAKEDAKLKEIRKKLREEKDPKNPKSDRAPAVPKKGG